MIIQSTDNTYIYNLLEKADMRISDFTADQVKGFENENDFCLVIYSAVNKNIVSFVAKDYIMQNELMALKEAVEANEDISSELLYDALDIINDIMADTAVFRFYLDAH